MRLDQNYYKYLHEMPPLKYVVQLQYYVIYRHARPYEKLMDFGTQNLQKVKINIKLFHLN